MAMRAMFSAPRKTEPNDDFSSFSCGVPLVDHWAHTRAHEAERKGTAVVYVVKSGEAIAGFYSLSAHSVLRNDVQGGWLKRNAPDSIPAILLGMLGVDVKFQGCGLGSSLLADAIRRSLAISEDIGAKAILVDPVDESALSFYSHYGFVPIPGMDRMFLSLKKL